MWFRQQAIVEQQKGKALKALTQVNLGDAESIKEFIAKPTGPTFLFVQFVRKNAKAMLAFNHE